MSRAGWWLLPCLILFSPLIQGGTPRLPTLVLLAYCVGLVGHQFFGWRGRRMNLVAIGAYLSVILAMALVHHFFPSFHDFSLRGEAS